MTPDQIRADDDDSDRVRSTFDRADNTARLALELAEAKREIAGLKKVMRWTEEDWRDRFGLTEETRIRCGQPVGEFLGHPMACGACQFIRPGACGNAIESRRLVSPWRDVEP